MHQLSIPKIQSNLLYNIADLDHDGLLS